MKKLLRVCASEEISNDSGMLFTVEDILWLLQNIEELKTRTVDFDTIAGKGAGFIVGDYTYCIPAS